MTEEYEIKRFGGVPQRNSGRGWKEKGDATLGRLLIDVKEYTESFSVSRKKWAKLKSDAFKSGGNPALMLALGSDESKDKLRLWVVEDAVFKEMYETWEEKYGQQG